MLCQLPITLPPFFDEAARINIPHRWVALYYSATNAVWDADGFCSSFSYYSLYAPMMEHFCFRFFLARAEADLGTDDTLPRHALLLDRQERTVYLGHIQAVKAFIQENQEPSQTTVLPEPENLTRLGMFEMLGGVFGGGYSAAQQSETKALIEHLDSCVTEEMALAFHSWMKDKDYPPNYSVLCAFQAFYQRWQLKKQKASDVN